MSTIRIYSKKDIKSADDVTANNTCAVAYKIDEQLRTKEGTVNVVRGYPELYYTELNHYSDDLDVVQAALMGYLSKVGEPTGKYSKSELKLMQKKIEELCSRLSELNPVTSIGGNGYGNK